MTGDEKLFEAAFPYGEDILALPVKCIDEASAWYGEKFGLTEVERRELPQPMIIMERDGVRIGFAVNGIDPSNEGAAILVSDIARAKVELESSGITTANSRIDERDGKRFNVFFVVAPDGLCYYFHQPIE